MDSQAIIDRIKSDVKDKTLLVRFFNLQNGTDLWIDGLVLRLYDFDMADYLREEFGIQIWDMKLSYNILESDDAFINTWCFHKGVFNSRKYDDVNSLIDAGFSEEAIGAGEEFGISVDSFADAYKGEHKNFVSFATGLFDELEMPEVPERFREFIDYEKYAESLEQQYHFSDGHVFDATVK